jgi:hypothetical protein
MTIRQELAKKCALIGAGIGLVLYAVFGFLQGALLGGTAGILAANWVFGPGTIYIMGGELITRMMVGAAMLTGVVVSLVMFVTLASTAGYIVGNVLGLLIGAESEESAQQTTDAGKA